MVALRPVTHRIRIARAEHKFSCAHMTVFADGSKERLHGHNYTIAVAIEVERIDLAAMIPFAPIKSVIGAMCTAWKEHLLLAERNPCFEIVRDSEELEFRLCGDRYVMPRADVVLVPIENVSVEGLAEHVAALLAEPLAPLRIVSGIEVRVEELPGIGASCYRGLH